MKKIIFLEVIRKLKSDAALMKKAKSLAIAGLVGFVLIGGLTLWAGVSAFKYLASSINQVVSSPIAQVKLQTFKDEIQRMDFQSLDCWGKAQSLAAMQPWIEKPALENLRTLKVACLNPKPTICHGQSCEQIYGIMNTAEGKII
jgi:hypothetical protein